MVLISTAYAAEAKAKKAYHEINSIEAYDAFIRTKDFESHIRFHDFADKFERSSDENLVVHMLEIHEIRRDALEAHGSGYCNANFGSRFAAKAAHEGWIEALRALKNCGFNLRGHGNWDWPSYKTVDGPAQMAAKSGQFEAMRYLVESEGAFSEPSPFADENEAPWRARFPLLNAISETKSADIAQYLMNRFKLEPEEVWNDPYRLSLGKLKIAHACGLDVTTMDLRKIRRGSEIANYVELAREDKSARMKRSAMRL